MGTVGVPRLRPTGSRRRREEAGLGVAGEEEGDLVRVADLPPRGVHALDGPVFVVDGDDEHGHREDGLDGSEVFFMAGFLLDGVCVRRARSGVVPNLDLN